MNALSSVAASGMLHATTMLRASASNVANVLSDGYQARRVAAVSAAGGGVSSVVSLDTTPGARVVDSAGESRELSNVDLARELVSARAAEFIYAANAAVIRTADEAVGTLLDHRA